MKIMSVSAQQNNKANFQGVSSRINCFQNFKDLNKDKKITYLTQKYDKNRAHSILKSITQLYEHFQNHSDANLHIIEDVSGAGTLKVMVTPSDNATLIIRQQSRPIDFVKTFEYTSNKPIEDITGLAKRSAEKISNFLNTLNIINN